MPAGFSHFLSNLRDAKLVLGNLQLAFLKKVLSIEDDELRETLRLAEPELSALSHRRHNAGVWELEDGAPNFRIVKDADVIKIEVVGQRHTHAAYLEWAKDKSSGQEKYADLRQWWRENPR